MAPSTMRRLNPIKPSVILRHRTEKSLRTDNNSAIVLENSNHNNRQSLICVVRHVKTIIIPLDKV